MTRVPDSELVLVPGGSLITAGAPLAFTVMVAVSIATRPPHPGRRRRHHVPPARLRDAAGRERPGDGGQGGHLLRSWNECG